MVSHRHIFKCISFSNLAALQNALWSARNECCVTRGQTTMGLLREMASLEVLSCTNVAIKTLNSVSGLLNTNDTDVTAGYTLLTMTPR